MTNAVLFKEYCAIRVGLHSLFDQINTADPDLAQYVDSEETIRVMLADFFYGDMITPIGKKVIFGDRIVAFKDHATKEIQKPGVTNSLIAITDVFWSLSDHILSNVLKASETYTHTPSHCFYQYIPSDKTIVVYTPVLEGLAQPTSVSIHLPAVVFSCYGTLPLYLRDVFNKVFENNRNIQITPQSQAATIET